MVLPAFSPSLPLSTFSHSSPALHVFSTVCCASPPSPSQRPSRVTPNSPATHSTSTYQHLLSLSHSNPRAASSAFRAAVQATPNDPRLWLAWAQLETRASRFRTARHVFDNALKKHPLNNKLLHAYATMEEKAGNLQKAVDIFQRGIRVNPNDGLMWQSLALLEDRRGCIDKARQFMEKGVERDEENVYLWSAWGVLEYRHAEYERACYLLEEATNRDERHIRSWQAWALAEEKRGQFEKSRELFETALDIDERNVPTLQAYAMFEMRRERYQNARDLFEMAGRINPRHAPIWHAWAVMERNLGDFKRARELFYKGLEVAPQNKAMLRSWAGMERGLGHIDRSSDWLVPNMRSGKRERRQMGIVGENLRMLRMMIERKSDEDVGLVMQWLAARATADRKARDAIAARRDQDTERVRQWIERRSESDVRAFRNWVDERYETDSQIGVYLFNWQIPQQTKKHGSITPKQGRLTEKPVEWLLLAEQPKKALQDFDEDIYVSTDRNEEVSDLMKAIGTFAETFADRAALSMALGAITIALIGMSVHLFNVGYLPGTAGEGEAGIDLALPMGVDAYLYDVGIMPEDQHDILTRVVNSTKSGH